MYLEVHIMEYCNEKMNIRGTMRCELEANHDGAHKCEVAKAPKKNGKVMRGIIIAGDTVTHVKPVTTCKSYMHKLAECNERIDFLMEVGDARGHFTDEELAELVELGAGKKAVKLIASLQSK